MTCVARLFVRGMADRTRVLVYSTTNYLAFRDELTHSLQRASAQMPGTVAEPADLQMGQLGDGDDDDGKVVFLGGAVEAPAPMEPAEFRGLADFVAATLVEDGFELVKPVEMSEGPA